MRVRAAEAEASSRPQSISRRPARPSGPTPRGQEDPPTRRADSGVLTCRCRGMRRCCIARTTLISPAIPAAASRWPTLVLTDPMTSGDAGSRPSRKTLASALTSIGSPSGVPVPCASTYCTSCGTTPAADERLPDHGLLRGTVGRGQAVAAPILVDGGSANDGDDAIAVLDRAREPLEHDHGASFAADVAVGRGVERLAPAVGRHHARLGQVDVHLGRENQVDAAGQRDVALARPQALTREMNADERRGTRGVNHEARAVRPSRYDSRPAATL